MGADLPPEPASAGAGAAAKNRADWGYLFEKCQYFRGKQGQIKGGNSGETAERTAVK
jgi:hypothetical protein